MNWYALFSAIITLLCAIITTVVVPWIKSKVSADNLDRVLIWVKIAVQSAEMIYTEMGKGTEKKEYVINFISELLMKNNINLTYDEINNLIESAVKELKLKESVAE